VVDSAFTTALAVEDLLDVLDARAGSASGSSPVRRIATTGDVDAFLGVAEPLFGEAMPSVESVELEPVGAALPLD
jgi:hypothetical protein